MKHTTLQRTTAAVCGALIAGSAFGQSGAAWGEPSGRPHERPRLMMYASLPFGDAHAQRPSFGLRLESAPVRAAARERIPFVDFQIQGPRSALMLAGMPVLHERDSSDSNDTLFDMDSLNRLPTPVKVAGVAVAVLGVACATRLLCKKHGNDGPAPYTPPATGGTGGTGTGG